MELFATLIQVFFVSSFATATFSQDGGSSANRPNWSSELMTRIQEHTGHQPEIYSHALKVMEGLKSSPSCIRLAVSTLVDTCQSLETKGDDIPAKSTELALDEVKSEFAARLAMCELAGARATLPDFCKPLTPSNTACPRSRFSGVFSWSPQDVSDKLCYPTVSDAQIKGCLEALESRPQWWTSYSNARQNAVVICQASRDMIEKDNVLRTYKSLTETVSNITATMQRSMQDHATSLETTKEYTEFLISLQNDATRAFTAGNKESQVILTKFLVDIQSSISLETAKMLQAWSETESRIDALNQIIKGSSTELEHMRQNTAGTFGIMLSRISEQNALHDDRIEYSSSLAVELLRTLEDARRSQLEAFSETAAGLSDVRVGLQLVDQNLADMRLSQAKVHAEITSTELRLTDIKVDAEFIKQTMTDAAEYASTLSKLVGYARFWQWILIAILIVLCVMPRSPTLAISVLVVLFVVTSLLDFPLPTLKTSPEVLYGVSSFSSSIWQSLPNAASIWVMFGVASAVTLAVIFYFAFRRMVLTRYNGGLLPSIEVPRVPSAERNGYF
ncbi:hypothetical protein EJ05DRAFT_508835 [Pseudovirgaria hyperparasitica]|uniref:Nuclear membrane fusion protein Kar5 n=1 Tax=Pseudovirgaria hyperparasitica TaxID=470096 RepID=A0A6A6WGK2_9PEZI|nr:uncharacterized protein EJ05DRAFT_508835 [Pseudovirgaria hyperparasitica]KAF2760281.1 hypothetical protein EJ05DRAFT_508835 [Pseudovirgaria hyperparasitica]